MTVHKTEFNRKSIRLPGWDYSGEGINFVTMCTYNRRCLFCSVIDSEMILNDAGQCARKCVLDIAEHFPNAKNRCVCYYAESCSYDCNDVRGRRRREPDETPQRPNGTSKTIGSIVRGVKIGVTKWCRIHTDIDTVWQRNYYEHIIRNEDELKRIRQYIINNPAKWDCDTNNPINENMTIRESLDFLYD